MIKKIKVVISVVICLVAFIYLYQYIKADELIMLLDNISAVWLLISIGLFLTYQLLRTYRFRLILRLKAINLWSLYNTLCIHSFLNANLPAGLGEGALVYLLKMKHKVTISKGSMSVLIARIIDLFLFTILFLIFAVFWYSKIPAELLVFVLILSSLIVLIVVFLVSIDRIICIKSLKAKTNFFFRLLNDLLIEFRDFNKRHDYIILVCYSVVMWATMYFYFYSVTRSLKAGFSIVEVLFIYLCIFPINLLPVKGIANIGSHETAWFICLVILGFDQTKAALLSVGTHIIFFFVLAVCLLFPLADVVNKKLTLKTTN